MECPKSRALSAVEMCMMEATYLMRHAGRCDKAIESHMEQLLVVHCYIKESPCPGGAESTGGC